MFLRQDWGLKIRISRQDQGFKLGLRFEAMIRVSCQGWGFEQRLGFQIRVSRHDRGFKSGF